MFRFNLHKKVLFALCLLSIIPLVVMALNSNTSLRSVETLLRVSATEALDSQAAGALELRAEMVAGEVADFLHSVEGDLRDLALMPATEETYLEFGRNHLRQVWQRAGTNEAPGERREQIPLYSELALIGPDGVERLRIAGGEVAETLRDVSDPANTTYLSETYFPEASVLPAGRIYVSHVTGWHIDKETQLWGETTPEAAVEGAKFRGVVRFAMPLRNADGALRAVVVLSLDHQHLMEFTQHISPTEEKYVLFPSYSSGNYAFMFDDEGWIITHPKYWDVRGLDSRGRLIPPYTVTSSQESVEKGLIPYNLFHAGFIHPNYPVVAKAVLGGRAGVVDITNVGGSEKIMAYAPIPYRGGNYEGSDVFGGITIGAELENFHRPALQASSLIRREFTRFVSKTWLLIFVTGLFVVFAAYFLSRGITGPLLHLIRGTKEMAHGNLDADIVVTSGDEVGELTESFNLMAARLKSRRQKLLKAFVDLRRSRREIMRERNFVETIVENVEAGILTLDAERRVTSVTGPACRILALPPAPGGLPLAEFLRDWPEILASLEPHEWGDAEPWSCYVDLQRGGKSLNFRLAHLPLTFGGEGHILTVEDLTERVSLRRRIERMDRLASLGRLSAGIAHEIRNPLTGVSLLLDDLHDRLPYNSGDQVLVRRALGEIERLEGLVGELLTFSSRTRLEPGDLGAVLRDTLFLVGRQAQKGNVEMVQDFAEGLPAFPLDPGKLKQAFLNLLTNAIESMPGGGRLTVTSSFSPEEVRVSISDTGEGISGNIVPLIFEPFYTSKGEGTGLGLSITHNIVSDHGGRIEVESAPGEGTSFNLFFPVSSRSGE